MKQRILTANANMGIGFWTAICYFAANIGGVESKNFLKKHDQVLKTAKDRLSQEFINLGPGYKLTDFRVTWTSPLSVTVSGLASKDEADDSVTRCPNCNEPINEDMMFCGNCGQKLK